MERKNLSLKVYLGSMKKKWISHCEAIGKKPGVAVKEMIEEQLRRGSDLIDSDKLRPIFQQEEERPDENTKVRMELRLTVSEKNKLAELAKIENCSSQTWITNVIRASLTHQPQCGMREIEALGESNYQLLAIGRNLNQIAKVLNMGSNPPITMGMVIKLRSAIKAHVEIVSKALRASVERWTIK